MEKAAAVHISLPLEGATAVAAGNFDKIYSQPSTHMRTRRLFEASVPLLTELRLLMWVEFLLHRLDMDSHTYPVMRAWRICM